jgi:hypothetical protein
MRPDPDSDLAGTQSEYGDDTGFAAEATRSPAPDDAQSVEANAPDETAGLTAEDDPTDPAGPGTGAD